VKLHSPQFQRQLRQGVKKAIRESPGLMQEYRLAKKFRKPVISPWVFRGIFSQVLGFIVLVIVTRTGHPVTGLAVITLWTFAGIFISAQRLWTVLHTDSDIQALRLLPVSDATIFRWELQKFLRKTLMSLLDLTVGFGVLGLLSALSPARWLAVPLVILLSWLMLLSLTALCVLYVSRKTYQTFAGLLMAFAFFVFIANSLVGAPLLNFLDRAAPDLNLLLPTGWSVSLFQLLLPECRWTALLLLLPIGCIIGTLKYSLNCMRNDFRFEEQMLPVVPDLSPGMDADDLMDEPGSPETSPAARSSQRPGPTEIEEMVESRRFLLPESWHQRGWLEQRLWNWLGAREKVLSDFLFPKGYAITAPWLQAVRNLAIAVAVAFALGPVSPTGKCWVLGIGLFITGLQALGQILNSGAAFRPMFCSGVNIPVYAGYGIGYRELSRLLIKCCMVQLPFFLPFITVCGMLVALMVDWPWQTGIVIGFKAGILLFGARFITIMFAFSGGTNDNSKFRVRTLMLFAAIISLGLAFLGLGAASLLVPAPSAWIFPGLAVLDAYVLFRVYGWFYHANRFDLMQLPRN